MNALAPVPPPTPGSPPPGEAESPVATAARRPRAAWRGRLALVAAAALPASLMVTALLATLAASNDEAAGGLGPEVRPPAIRGGSVPFSLDDVRHPGTRVVLAGRPGRPVIVVFFAAWCVPCRRELRDVAAAHRRAAPIVDFIGVDVSDSRSAAAQLLDETGVGFPAGYDPDGDVARRYRLRGMPSTVFVSGDGRVVGAAGGSLSHQRLARWLARLRPHPGVGWRRDGERGMLGASLGPTTWATS